MNHFQGLTIHNAIYTIDYDTTRTKLFSAGGPLQLGLSGNFASIFT